VAATKDTKQQEWTVIYLDKSKDEDTKGFNEEYGFYINRPFYLRSRMPFHRVAECRGASDARIFRWRANTTAQ